MPIPVTIQEELCTGCGLCLAVCPDDAFALAGGRATVAGSRCLACGHCLAVCPAGAVTVAGIEHSRAFRTFAADNRYLPPGESDPAQLARLMLSRRSCRRYLKTPVSPDLLSDLVAMGTSAPSGTNCQAWTFTILAERQDVEFFGEEVAASFEKLNRLAQAPFLRHALRWLGKPALNNYYHRYCRTIREGLRQWREEGRDRLFHGAPAAIIVGARPEASCPLEDALLASQNILLGAHALGLGTCLIGFAVAAMGREPAIKKKLGIPAEERIAAVIALGYPAVPYRRLTGRKPAQTRRFRAAPGP